MSSSHGDGDGQPSDKPVFLSLLTGQWMDIPENSRASHIFLALRFTKFIEESIKNMEFSISASVDVY